MNELQIFNNAEFGQIRTVTKDNEPWFVASDIAKALGYRMASDLVRRIDDDDKGTHIMSTQGGEQAMLIINESGFYSSILNSKLESAKRFKHWVTSEVLPSIRKSGGYIAGQEQMSDTELMAKALLVAQKQIEERNKQIELMKPKAEFFDAVTDSKTAFSMNEVAKILDFKGIGRNKLFEFLRAQGILDRYNVPYQKYVDYGWFRVIEQKYVKDGEPVVTTKTLVYQKGVDVIRRKLQVAYGET